VKEIDFWVDFCSGNSNKLQNLGLGKFSWAFNVFTLGPMAHATLVYLWSKVVYFVLLAESPSQSVSSCTLGIAGKFLMSKGAPTWFETVWSYGVEAIDYWTIF